MSQRSIFPRDGLPTALRADFEAFWAAFPLRKPNPRALAEKAFAKAVKRGAKPADLIAAAGAYAAEVKRQGVAETFIVHARTFISQDRWQDYVPKGEAAAPSASASVADHPLWLALCSHLSEAEFRAWILPLKLTRPQQPGEAALLVAPSRFHRNWIRQHHADRLRAALRVQTLSIEVAEDIRL